MIKEAVKLVENSDESCRCLFKVKEMALDHELKEIAKAIGAQKYDYQKTKMNSLILSRRK